jgi:hypothetical protein
MESAGSNDSTDGMNGNHPTKKTTATVLSPTTHSMLKRENLARRRSQDEFELEVVDHVPNEEDERDHDGHRALREDTSEEEDEEGNEDARPPPVPCIIPFSEMEDDLRRSLNNLDVKEEEEKQSFWVRIRGALVGVCLPAGGTSEDAENAGLSFFLLRCQVQLSR